MKNQGKAGGGNLQLGFGAGDDTGKNSSEAGKGKKRVAQKDEPLIYKISNVCKSFMTEAREDHESMDQKEFNNSWEKKVQTLLINRIAEMTRDGHKYIDSLKDSDLKSLDECFKVINSTNMKLKSKSKEDLLKQIRMFKKAFEDR